MLGLYGCDGDGGTDAGPPDDDGGGGTDAGGGGGDPVVQYLDDMMMLQNADFSCRGSATAPTAGADVTFDAVAGVFGSEDVAEGLTIQFYPDNQVMVDGTCNPPCIEGATDAMGALSVTAPADAWYGYRIEGGMAMVNGLPQEFITVVQTNEEAPAMDGDSVGMSAITAALRDQIVLLLGTSAEPGTATITGFNFDCNGEAVANANIRVFDDSGQVEIGFVPSGPREFYFNGDQFPQGSQRRTNTDGLYGVANLPIPASGGYRVEIWGAVEDGMPAEMLGCEQIDVVADGVTIINVGPTRSDGPSGCSG